MASPHRPSQNITDWLQEAWRGNHRAALILQGAPDLQREAVNRWLAALPTKQRYWIGADLPLAWRGAAPERAGRVLGRSLRALVLDMFHGLDPDALGASLGALAGGGVFVLLAPPMAHWEAFDDPLRSRFSDGLDEPARRFQRRFARVLAESDAARVVDAADLAALPVPAELAPTAFHLTDDQTRAMAQVEKAVAGRAGRPAVLVSDRGRGKSTVLGAAARQLADRHGYELIITGPSAASTQTATTAAEGALRFVAPDELLREPQHARAVMVDEAAALPLPVLQALLRHYRRVVFATTVHGYEGSGRGFEHRFKPYLRESYPDTRFIDLSEPVRWAEGDPLEALLDRALLLNAEPAAEIDAAAPVRVREVERAALCEDEALLGQVFGLLVQAHYQTRPYDLRYLMDSPAVRVFVAERGDAIAGVALMVEEGDLPESIRDGVHTGRRRIRGHLLPQSMAFHLDQPAALGLRFGRIMRIAVHPDCRRGDVGSAMLRYIASAWREAGGDALGSSFGATEEVLAFWFANGYRPLRVGISRDAASGTHAVMVGLPLTESATEVLAAARRFGERQWRALLGEQLQWLSPDVIAVLASGFAVPANDDADDLGRSVARYARGETRLEDVWGDLSDWLFSRLARRAMPVALGRNLLIQRLLQHRAWADIARDHGLAGRKAVEDVMRSYLSDFN